MNRIHLEYDHQPKKRRFPKLPTQEEIDAADDRAAPKHGGLAVWLALLLGASMSLFWAVWLLV